MTHAEREAALPLDATEIVPGLWIGSVPPIGDAVRRAGFNVLVLCAEEFQMSAQLFPGVEVIHAPNDDSGRPPTPAELRIAKATAGTVARLVRAGNRVLVTCAAGRNRSGLVVALALSELRGWSGRRVIGHVQTLRYGALQNPWFNNVIAARKGDVRVLRGGKVVGSAR